MHHQLEEKRSACKKIMKEKYVDLKKVKEHWEKISESLEQEELIYQKSIGELRQKLEQDLAQKKIALKQNLQNKQKQVEKSLKELELTSLTHLRTAIAADHPHFEEDLRKQWIKGNSSLLLAKDKVVSRDLESLNNYLTRELTKIGYSLEGFMEKAWQYRLDRMD
jgi:Mlc titration factor MtfA (ptsG expression regulator)